jgi:hemerythrin-like domain-containing protein
MQPIGPLMIEHRLIERMVKLMRQELERIRANILVDPKFAFVDPFFIDGAVDFLRTYADRCHHGKEEDILFAELAAKDLDPELKKIMEELTAEHVLARDYTKELVAAKENYLREEPEAVGRILFYLDKLTAIYPKHIATEDQHFFIPCMSYFTAAEKDAMLARMWEFDRQMIHEKYEGAVSAIENRRACGLGHKEGSGGGGAH